jgi:hypothetical protein
MQTGKIVIHQNGDFYTYNENNELHSFAGKPAESYSNANKLWYQNGKLHNDSREEKGRLLPAEFSSNGDKLWYQYGQFHNDSRDDDGKLLPATIKSNGDKCWYQNGYYHNDDKDQK